MGLKLNGANGGGSVELDVPSTVNSDLALTIPATAGEIVVKATDGSVDLGNANIDSSGRLLVNTSSTGSIATASPLQVVAGAGAWGINLRCRTNNDYGFLAFTSHDSNEAIADIYSIRDGTSIGSIGFGTNNGSAATSERMRILKTGELCIGTSAAFNAGHTNIQFDGSTRNGICLKTTRTQNGSAFLNFIDSDGNSIGSVQQATASTVTYVGSSDYRLKENVVAISDGISRVKQLKPSRFNFIKHPDQTVDGFIAHEAQTVVPEAVVGEKDATKEEQYIATPAVLGDDGREVTPAVIGTRTVPDHQGIDQSKLVPLLTAALQEAIAKIETLETKVAALEAK